MDKKYGLKTISGNWTNGLIAGSRCVNLNNYPWNVNTNNSSRFACECIVLRVGVSKERQPVIVIQSGFQSLFPLKAGAKIEQVLCGK